MGWQRRDQADRVNDDDDDDCLEDDQEEPETGCSGPANPPNPPDTGINSPWVTERDEEPKKWLRATLPSANNRSELPVIILNGST